jgi:Epoxide hydrolase N terminus
MTPQPFTIRAADDVLADLRARLERVRWPDEVPGAAWRYGTSVAYMKELVAYWRDNYDWRAQEAEINRFTQFTVAAGGIGISSTNPVSARHRSRCCCRTAGRGRSWNSGV